MADRAIRARHMGGGVVVDIGCGTGTLYGVLKGAFDRYVGVDIVHHEGFPAGAEFVQADLDTGRAPLPDCFADIVVSAETIEHVENPRAFFRDLVRLARPGGWVVVTTPNQLSWLSKLSLLLTNQFPAFKEAPGLYPAHLTALLEIDLLRMARECGLVDIATLYSGCGRVPGTPWHWPAWLGFRGRRFSDNVLVAAQAGGNERIVWSDDDAPMKTRDTDAEALVTRNTATNRSVIPGKELMETAGAVGKTAYLYMFFWALSLFTLTNCGFDTSEGESHYMVANLFVETGNIGFPEPRGGVFTTAPNGRTYASHEFGNVLCLIPTAALNHVLGRTLPSVGVAPSRVARLQQFIVSLQANVYCALTIMFLFLILIEEFHLTNREAFVGCLVFATCTFFWNYSRNLFDGVLCGLLLTGAIRYLLRFRREGKSKDVLIAFACLGFAVDTRLSMVLPLVAAVGFVLLFCTGHRSRGLAAAVIAVAPFAVWQLWYNNLRSGNPLVSPVQTSQFAANNGLDGNLAAGLLGILFSPGKSLFVYAPVVLVSLVVFPAFWRRNRATALLILTIGISWLLLHARLRSWYGAWGWGPRHFVTILPVLSIPALVFIPALCRCSYGKATVAIVASFGFLLGAASMIGNWYYQMGLRNVNGTLSDDLFVWNIAHCQPMDMLAAAVHNIEVVGGLAQPFVLPGASDLNNYASNRINMWWFTMPGAGVPLVLVISLVGVLLFGLAFTTRRLLQRQTDR